MFCLYRTWYHLFVVCTVSSKMGLGISNESIRHQQIIAKGEGYHTRYEHDECIIVVMFYVLYYSLIASGIKMDWDSKKNCRAAPYTIHATFIRIVHAWNEGLLHDDTYYLYNLCMMSIHAKRDMKSMDCSVLQKYRNGWTSQL